MKKISFVLPIYNEAMGLPALFKELTLLIKELTPRYQIEFILVNDGSTDNSLAILQKFAQQKNHVVIINFSRNFGHQIAVTAGLDKTHGDAVIIMDSDLQDPPMVSLQLIKKWEDGYQVVYAQRRGRKDSLFKRITAFLFYRLLNQVSNTTIPVDTGDFRLIDKKVVRALRRFPEKHRFIRGLVSYVGFKQTAIKFDRSARYAGTTNYSFSKMFHLATDAVTGFSDKPLKLLFKLGFLLWIIGLLNTIWISWGHKLLARDLYIILISVIISSTGIILVGLGVLGSYIGRIYTESQQRPLYLIESILDNRKNI